MNWQTVLCWLGFHVMWGLAYYRPARESDWRVCMRNRPTPRRGKPQPCDREEQYDGERWALVPPLPPVRRSEP